MVGNIELVEYGIQTESADYRAHVCPVVKHVYIFSVAVARRLIEAGGFEERSTHDGRGHETARGLLVPPELIPNMQQFRVADRHWKTAAFSMADTPTVKGEKAVRCVIWLLRSGVVKLPMCVTHADVPEEVAGTDLIAMGTHRFQVKCDYRGGPKHLGGTGSLYLQTMECNPDGVH